MPRKGFIGVLPPLAVYLCLLAPVPRFSSPGSQCPGGPAAQPPHTPVTAAASPPGISSIAAPAGLPGGPGRGHPLWGCTATPAATCTWIPFLIPLPPLADGPSYPGVPSHRTSLPVSPQLPSGRMGVKAATSHPEGGWCRVQGFLGSALTSSLSGTRRASLRT